LRRGIEENVDRPRRGRRHGVQPFPSADVPAGSWTRQKSSLACRPHVLFGGPIKSPARVGARVRPVIPAG
jgi:hypothetical protein